MSDDARQQRINESVARLREYARGELPADHRDAHPYAAIVEDPAAQRVLAFMAETYDHTRHPELPRSFWDTKFAQDVLRRHGSQRIAEAVKSGSSSMQSYMTGAPEFVPDVSGMHTINRLEDWLVNSEQCKLIYIASLMGRGKTDLSSLLLETVWNYYQRLERAAVDELDLPEVELAANFHLEPSKRSRKDGARVRLIDNWPELQEWAEEGDSSMERWFVFDEASTELTAQSGANAQDVAETMGPFVKKMRKAGINMIVIGHDKRDVHVAIRSMADFIAKGGLKTASFYQGIKKREPTGHLFDVEGLPPTSWEFDTDDAATWDWGEESEELDEGMTDGEFRDELATRGARLWLQTELSQGEIAENLSNGEISISRSTISRRATEIERSEQATSNAAIS